MSKRRSAYPPEFRRQMVEFVRSGRVRDPFTYLPCRPTESCKYERVKVSDLNRYFETVGTEWRMDNGDEMADSLFETEWWNLQQVLARVYLRESAVVREGASFYMRLREEATSSPSVCDFAFAQAEEALIEALRTRKLIAYGFKNGEDDLTEIPALQWVDRTFCGTPTRFCGTPTTTSTAPVAGLRFVLDAKTY